jgi:hypothetical protein
MIQRFSLSPLFMESGFLKIRLIGLSNKVQAMYRFSQVDDGA